MFFPTIAPDNVLHARIEQTRCLNQRKLNHPNRAVAHGRLALRYARRDGNPGLISSTARNLAGALHMRSVCYSGKRIQDLHKALDYYTIAFQEDQFDRLAAKPGVQYYQTQAMRAFAWYDMAHYKVPLAANDVRVLNRARRRQLLSNAQTELREATHQLRKLDDRTAEFDALLMYLQIAPFGEHAATYSRAKDLLILLPERQHAEIQAALLGRRITRIMLSSKMMRKNRSY